MASGEFKELIPFDQALLGKCRIKIVDKDIDLQFPPIVESDGKSSNWDSSEQAAYEPIKTYKGSESRGLSVKLKYVVVGGKWTPSRIAQIGRDIRSYFYFTTIINFKGYPLVGVQLYDVVPEAGGLLTFRLMNVRTSHSGGVITSGGGTYPLVTEHVLALEMATRIGPIPGSILGFFGPAGEAAIKIASQALTPAPKAEWY